MSDTSCIPSWAPRWVTGIRGSRLLLLTSLLLVGVACRAPEGGGPLRGTPLGVLTPKPDILLSTTDGAAFDFPRATTGYVTLLFFGYTRCPDICPVHMANLAAVLHKLPSTVAGRVKVIMVTVDPERDTPERLRAWLDNFDRDFIGLTGSVADITAMQQAVRLPPAVKEGEGDTYLVGHAAYVLAFTTDDQPPVAYPSGTRQSDWAHDLPQLVRRMERAR
jgi:protein SCO1/2